MYQFSLPQLEQFVIKVTKDGKEPELLGKLIEARNDMRLLEISKIKGDVSVTINDKNQCQNSDTDFYQYLKSLKLRFNKK